MAKSASEWTVLILHEDKSLQMMCFKAPDTTLADVMQTWRNEREVELDNWVFVSADGEIEYTDDQQTLQDIGEVIPGSQVIHLKVIPSTPSTPSTSHSENQFIEIFVWIDKECHRLLVEPCYQLYKVLPRMAVGKKVFEYKGHVLNLKQTVEEAGLRDKCVIHESTVRVSVKFTSGTTKSFRVPKEATMSELKAKIAAEEEGDFILKYRGRTIELNENVNAFKGRLEVAKSTFVVQMDDGRRFNWKTASGKIKFRDFVEKLYEESGDDRRILENTVYECSGCSRRIWKDEEDYQLVEADCCRRKSLMLKAKLPTDYKALTTARDFTDTRSSLKKKVANQPNTMRRETQTAQVITERRETQTEKVIRKRRETQTAQVITENQSIQHAPMRLKLLVLYWSDEFKVEACGGEIEERGKYQWSDYHHIKCQVEVAALPDDCMVEFQDLRALLKPLLLPASPEWRIQRIGQWRGVADGREVVEVTSRVSDEYEESGSATECCDSDGRQFPYGQVTNKWAVIREGGRVLVVPQRRTVLTIFKDK